MRDSEHHLVSTVGVEISRETFSKVTAEVLDEVMVRQQHPLETFYPVIYLNAIIVKVRDGAHVRNKADYIAVGVDMSRRRVHRDHPECVLVAKQFPEIGPGACGQEVIHHGRTGIGYATMASKRRFPNAQTRSPTGANGQSPD